MTRNQAGFTLIETLVAISILSVVTIALAGVLRTSLTVTSIGERLTGASDQGLVGFSRVHKDIRNMLPCSLFPVLGTPLSFQFATVHSVVSNETEILNAPAKVEYTVSGQDSSAFIRILYMPIEGKVDTTVIFDEVEALQLEYAARDESGEMIWSGEFYATQENDIPDLLRLRVLLSAGRFTEERNLQLDRLFRLPLAGGHRCDASQNR